MLSPPLMITLPSGSAGGFYSTWQPYTEATSPTSGSFSPVSPISRQSSPFPAISGFVNERSSWPSSVPLSDRQISESDSMPLSFATSMSYTVKSVNSRKSRLTVRYPRPVRPLLQSSIRSSLESLASRPSSASPARARPVADQEHVAQALATMSALFEPLPDSQPLPVEKRLTASWHSLLKMKAYEEIHCAPNMRATRSYADALHCIHGEIVGSDAAGAPELVRPCDVLNEAFERAYKLLSDPTTLLPISSRVSEIDADLFRSFVIRILQLLRLIRAVEVLIESLATFSVFKASRLRHGTGPEDDVIFNVPGWRQRKESRTTLPPIGTPDAADNTLRIMHVSWHEELERELSCLRFLVWRVSTEAKAELGSILRRTLPLHHKELMKSPVNDYVGHWQADVDSTVLDEWTLEEERSEDMD